MAKYPELPKSLYDEIDRLEQVQIKADKKEKEDREKSIAKMKAQIKKNSR